MNYNKDMSNMSNYVSESDRRERVIARKQKAKKKYNDRRIGKGQGRLSKVFRGMSSSKSSWSETRNCENFRKDSRRNMKKTFENIDVKLNKKKNKNMKNNNMKKKKLYYAVSISPLYFQTNHY